MPPSMSPSLPLPPHDFSPGLPFSSHGLSPSPTQGHTHFGLPPPSKKFKGRTNKNKDPIIIKNIQDSWVVPGIAAGGQQVPSFSQFSPTNLQSIPQQSPIPGFISPMFGMRNEVLGSDMGGRSRIGMGFAPSGEDIGIDSPKSSDFDMGHNLSYRGAASVRLRSFSSSGASMDGSIQDISLSGSHSSIPIMGSRHSSSNSNILGGEPIQSQLNNNLDSSPLIAGSSTTIAPMHPLKATPTGSSGHLPLLNDNMAATSLIAKPPSILNDHRDLHHTHSSSALSSGSPDPSLLHVAAVSVHHVETLPNSRYNDAASSDCYVQPHPFPPPPPQPHPPSGTGALPIPGHLGEAGGTFSSHNLMGSYHFSPPQQHGHHFAPLPVSSNSLHFAASSGTSYPRTLSTGEGPSNHYHHLLGGGFSKTNIPPLPPPSSAPAIHVDNELARVDEYMQQYLSESHSQESLKSGSILNATKEHDKLISQVLLMSPKHGNYDQRRSSNATTAVFLSMLEETGRNGRGLPFSPRSMKALQQSSSAGGRESLDDLTNATTTNDSPGDSVGLRSPLQRHHTISVSRSDSVGLRSPLQRQHTTSTNEHNSSTTSTPSSEANMFLTSSHSQGSIDYHHGHTHYSEAISDTSSGVSSASTKLSTTACSSGQSSPIGSTNSPTTLITPSATPSPSTSVLEDNFSYPPSVSRDTSQSSNRGRNNDLLDQIYEPYPALSNDEGEYMIENPDLRPPPAPKVKGKIDLLPEVPIFKVRWLIFERGGLFFIFSSAYCYLKFPCWHIRVLLFFCVIWQLCLE